MNDVFADLRRGRMLCLSSSSLQTGRPNNPKLPDQVPAVSRLKHCSVRTEQAYTNWIRRFIVFHSKQNKGVWRHPQEMAEAEVSEFLTYLADAKNVAASMALAPSNFPSR